MMHGIMLLASGYIPQIREKLHFYLHDMGSTGISINIEEKNWGQFQAWNCTYEKIREEKSFAETERLFRYYIAKVVADIIVNDLGENILRKKVDMQYPYFSPEERDIICQNALGFVRRGFWGNAENNGVRKGEEIFKRIFDYFLENNTLCIQGFAAFRLKDYMQKIESIVEKVVDDYIIEREYRDFIHLLKYFVELQEPRLEEVHVIVKETGIFQLEDAESRPIEETSLEEFSIGITDSQVEYEDTLISALIAISPQRIILHLGVSNEYQETLGIILNVFGKRVEICRNCTRCEGESKPSTFREQN